MRDTINWRDWSEAALAEAAAEHKPILLSLVTAWSEECAAMDDATYRRQPVVTVVESRCVAVRVDADKRPDLNERYNLGGWPTTALLTPDGHVLSGGTYLGPDELIALMNQVADAWRDRAEEIREKIQVRRAGLATGNDLRETRPTNGLAPDTTAVSWFRALLLDQFDRAHGGFGTGPKSPHVPAMQFALALADEEADAALKDVVDVTLGRIDTLWDSANGGFYRYADAADWSRPATEKTLDDNAAVLHLLLDAAVRLGSEPCRERAADLVRWVKHTLANDAAGGFFNSQAAVSRIVDRAMYADRNADMIGAFIRAAALFDDPWLRDFALKSLEAVVVPGYVPGGGVAHAPGVRGLLSDQIRVTSALMWAHLATDQLPYSMLAAELMQFAIRTMWDERASCFRDRVDEDAPLWPFALNCDAACLLDRLAMMTGDASYHDRAVTILATLSPDYQRHEIFAAPYALAIREVIERRGPPGLKLSHVDWHLDKD